ncbi:MAG: hypothetical protein Q9221_008583 [Calogaya cf. arnoldii]
MNNNSPHTSPHFAALTALIIGANGYLGTAVSNAFLRAGSLPTSNFFRVYGLVRRPSSARALAVQEIVPIVASLSSDSPDAIAKAILAHSRTWHISVVCTEPSKSDPVAQKQHWHDVLALVQELAQASTSIPSGSGAKAVTPLVLWSCGCKDYGTTGLHGDLQLEPHTESTPLNPPDTVRPRMDGALRALEVANSEKGGFDVVVLRALPMSGYSGSYYGAALEYVASFAANENNGNEAKILKFTSDADTIMHGVHVDDCADAYVALARTALFGIDGDTPQSRRPAIVGRVFNISGRRYETLKEVGTALAEEYGFKEGAQFSVSADNIPDNITDDIDYQSSEFVFGYSQWVSSERIRALTGWRDKRPLFSENVHAYHLAYEAAKEGGNKNVETIRKRMIGDWGE